MESIDSPRHEHIIAQLRKEILSLWPCQSLAITLNPIIPIHELQAFSCSPRHVVEQEQRPNLIGSNLMLRRQMADSMPGLLRTLARNPPEDLLLVCPGLIYQRGPADVMEARHELALWRIASYPLPLSCLDDCMEALARILPRGMRLRTRRCEKSYLVYSQGIEAYCRGWKWLGHCGLVNPMLLIESGFDPVAAHGVVLSLDLDRCMAVQDRWDEICLRQRS